MSLCDRVMRNDGSGRATPCETAFIGAISGSAPSTSSFQCSLTELFFFNLRKAQLCKVVDPRACFGPSAYKRWLAYRCQPPAHLPRSHAAPFVRPFAQARDNSSTKCQFPQTPVSPGRQMTTLVIPPVSKYSVCQPHSQSEDAWIAFSAAATSGSVYRRVHFINLLASSFLWNVTRADNAPSCSTDSNCYLPTRRTSGAGKFQLVHIVNRASLPTLDLRDGHGNHDQQRDPRKLALIKVINTDEHHEGEQT